MPRKDIIVVGTSSGGIEALRILARGLPKDLQASIFVVLHTSPDSPAMLPYILERAGPLPASNAVNSEQIQPGRIYVAPPDRHLLLERGHVRITQGPKENRFRPAVDTLFRSAAYVYGPRVIGVILTGDLDDGTAGLWAIKYRGGMAIVQDPEDALFPSMPRSAMENVEVDYCLPIAEIAPLLVRLTKEETAEEGEYPMSEEMGIEVKIAREDQALEAGVQKLGEPSSYACPECHGVLLQLKEGGHIRFRCHTGHAYSVNSLLSETTEAVEDSLWAAIRSIEESVLLMRHIAQHMSDNNHGHAAELFLQKTQEAQRRADLVRKAVMDHEKLSEDKMREVTAGS